MVALVIEGAWEFVVAAQRIQGGLHFLKFVVFYFSFSNYFLTQHDGLGRSHPGPSG